MYEIHRFGAIASFGVVAVAFCVSVAAEAARAPVAYTAVPTFVGAKAGVTSPVLSVTAGDEPAISTSPVQTSERTPLPQTAALAQSQATLVAPKVPPEESVRGAVAKQVEVVHEVAPLASVSPAVVVSDDASIDLAALALTIHERTNAVRKTAGLSPLAYDTALAKNARSYSERMQRDSLFSHTDARGCDMTCRFLTTDYEAWAWGENLAEWHASYEPSIDELATYFIREWKKSSGHRENMLSDAFTHEGVGVVMHGNQFYVTVQFADPK